MKRKMLVALILALALCLWGALGAGAEETAEEKWYEISADEQILTVRLPVNAQMEEDWKIEISDEGALELLTQEIQTGEEEKTGADSLWTARFRNIAGADTEVELKLVPQEKGAEAERMGYELRLNLGADGKIQVAEAQEPWYSLSDGGAVCTVRLPANDSTGYEWTWEISTPDALEVLRQEYVQDEAPEEMVGVGGTCIVDFGATMEECGRVTITFTYARQGETQETQQHTLELFVNEAGVLQVVSAQ